LENRLQILIISLASQTGRRSYQGRQMERLGLDFRFRDATRPDDIPQDEMTTRIAGWARPLRPTEVACLLSHRSVWKETAAGTSPVLVMEDDAVLSQRTPEILPILVRLGNVDLLNLETFRKKKFLGRRPTQVLEGYGAVFPLYRDRGGAACYLLWPAGAKKLLAYTETFSPLADAAINLAPGMLREQIVPALAVQEMHYVGRLPPLEKGIVSAGSRPKNKGFMPRLLGRSLRLYISIRVAMIMGKHALSASARDIPFADD
jgi:glycosyl transferase family 25